MNACEQSLANTPKRPPEATVPGVAPTPPDLPPDVLDRTAGEGSRADRWLLARMLSSLGSPAIELGIRGGARVAAGTPIARVTFESRSTLLWILADVPLRFGDAYSDGRVTVEGDLVTFLESVYRAGRRAGGERDSLARRAALALQRQHVNTLSGSRDNIHHHYDIGNAFYELWLGSTMAYTWTATT